MMITCGVVFGVSNGALQDMDDDISRSLCCTLMPQTGCQ